MEPLLKSRCNSNNIVKGRGAGQKLSAGSFGTFSVRLLQQTRYTEREGDRVEKQVLLPSPGAFNLQHQFSILISMRKWAPQTCKKSHLPLIQAMLDLVVM